MSNWGRNQKEEFANSLTHGLGLILIFVAAPILLSNVTAMGGVTKILSVSIYIFSLVVVYASSTIYHCVSLYHNTEAFPPLKKKFQLIDHICIFLLIAGTFTPFLVIKINADTSWFLVFIWVLAFFGIGFKIFVGSERYEIASVIFYAVMGCSALFYVNNLWNDLPGMSFWFLVFGGAFYLTGIIFFLWQTLKYHHAIWHLFTMGGSAFHFAALLHALNNDVAVLS